MRVLMVTVGATPQVVTETVYALIAQDWVPERILLLTTADGEHMFTEGSPPLVGAGGRLAALYAARAPGSAVPAPEILLPRRGGAIMTDIRTDVEVTAFAETLLKAVAEVTADPSSELHLSLAGGRKTMSFLAGSVLSFFGRPQDRLSHVLVEPAEYESSNLWWPGQPEPVTTRSGKSLDPNGARVLLHEVPYVRLAPWIEAEEVFPEGGPTSYAQAVVQANARLSAQRLIVDLENREVYVGSVRFKGPPFDAQRLAALALMAVAAKRGVSLAPKEDYGGSKVALGTDVEEARHIFGWFSVVLNPKESDIDLDLDLVNGNIQVAMAFNDLVRARGKKLDWSYFGQKISKIRTKWRATLGRRKADRFCPSVGQLALPADNIEVRLPLGTATLPGSPL